MLDGASIDIQGLKSMEAALLEIAKKVGARKATGMMTSAFKKGADKYKNHMTRHANVSKFARTVRTKSGSKVTITPGFLKSRIKVKGSTGKGRATKRLGKDVVSKVSVGVFKVPYIVQQEYGTENNKPNPIIRDAFKKRTKQVVHVVNHQLKANINKAQKSIARKHAKSVGA